MGDHQYTSSTDRKAAYLIKEKNQVSDPKLKYTRAALLFWITILSIVLITGGDRLPNQTPENQIFSIDTTLDAIGTVKDKNTMSWVVASPNAIPTGILGAGQSVSDTLFIDSILTNGGKLSENKNFDFNSKNPSEGLYNIENQKVLTYTSTDGAHMVGEEEYTLSVAGNYSTSDGNIRCVFSQNSGFTIPAFCNIVSAKSALVNIKSAQISSKGQIRAVAETIDVPTALNYRLAVSPDLKSGRSYAEGGVRTVFVGSAMEARDGGDANYLGSAGDGTSGTWNKTSLVRTWKDTTTVVGQIRNVQKNFDDPSEIGSMFTPPQEQPTIIPTPTASPTSCAPGTLYFTNNDFSDNPGSYWIEGGSHVSLGTIYRGTTISVPNLPSGDYYGKIGPSTTGPIHLVCGGSVYFSY